MIAGAVAASPVSEEMRYMHGDPGDARVAQWRALYESTRSMSMSPRINVRTVAAGITSATAATSPEQLRIIGELGCPLSVEDLPDLRAAIDGWADRNYNAVLCVWYGEADVSGLVSLMEYSQTQGFTIILAIGEQGPWDLNVPMEIDPRFSQWDSTPYHDADALANAIEKLTPLADYVLPVWRGTSPSHWWDYYLHASRGDDTTTRSPDMGAFADYADTVARLCRAGNAKVKVLGVVESLKNMGRKTEPRVWVPSYADAVLVIGVAQQRQGVSIWPRKVRGWVSGLIGHESPPVIIGPVFWPSAYWWHNPQRKAETIPYCPPDVDAATIKEQSKKDKDGKVKSKSTKDKEWKPSSATKKLKIKEMMKHSHGHFRVPVIIQTTPAGSNVIHALSTIKSYPAWSKDPNNLRGCGYAVTYEAEQPGDTNTLYQITEQGTNAYDAMEWASPSQPLEEIDDETELTMDWVLGSTNVLGALRLVGDGSGPRRGNSDRIGYHSFPWPE